MPKYSKEYIITKRYRHNKKRALLELGGGKCQCCGYNRSFRSLNFHHVDPSKKVITVSFAAHSIIKLLDEIIKCILVCANCHGEIHDGILNIDHIPLIIITNDQRENILHRFGKHRKKRTIICLCGKKKNKASKMCRSCKGKLFFKVIRPSRIDLKRMIWQKPTEHIAKEFGVSGVAVGKWCKSYGIVKPPRGYWQKKNSPNQIRTDISR